MFFHGRQRNGFCTNNVINVCLLTTYNKFNLALSENSAILAELAKTGEFIGFKKFLT